MIAIPWGFPTASSMLPNKVEFQWIRWSWTSNDRQATSLLKVLLFRRTKIHQVRIDPIHVVWYATRVSQIGTKRWLVNLGSLCEFLPSYFSTEAGLSASQVLLLSWSGAHLRGLADFKLISLPSLEDIPSGSHWNETPGLVTNMRTHWKDEYLYNSSTVSPTISIKNDSLTFCKLVQLSKYM